MVESQIKTYDIHDDLILHRFGNGIQLLKLEKNSKRSKTDSLNLNVRNILQLPCNVYFTEKNLVIASTNEITANLCGYDSVKSIIGKNVFSIGDKKSVYAAINNDKITMSSQKLLIRDEEIILPFNNLLIQQCLTIKLPWYDENGKILGIIGFSIVYGRDNFAEALSEITQLDLLNSSLKNPHSLLKNSLQIGNVTLTRRETECVKLCVRGKTAKEIGLLLGLSSRTVECYLENIKNKLNVTSKNDLINKVFDYLYPNS